MYALVFEATQIDLTHGHLEPDCLTGVNISGLNHFCLKIWFGGRGGRNHRGNEEIQNIVKEIHARALSVTAVLVFKTIGNRVEDVYVHFLVITRECATQVFHEDQKPFHRLLRGASGVGGTYSSHS